MSEYKHVEAFCLMWYATQDDKERERIWNSRDGVTPFIIHSATTAAEIAHTDWRQDVRAPNHVPKVGDRIFVDLTEARARVFAARRLDLMLEDPECRASLEAEFASRAEASAALTKAMLEEHGGGSPDILVVTAGYIEELLEARKRGAEPEVTMAMDHGVGESWAAVGIVLPGTAKREYDIERVEICIGGVRVETSGAMRERSQLDEDRAAADGFTYYDREVKPISRERYWALFEDDSYRQVKLTKVSESVLVSTIWLGLDHGFGRLLGQRPILFETMVVTHRTGAKDPDYGEMRRDHTEAEALETHERVVLEERAKGN